MNGQANVANPLDALPQIVQLLILIPAYEWRK